MIISIVNHKGGTGKTTTAINLGSVLAARGNKVLLVDFDAQGSLSYSLGVDDEPSIADAFHGAIQVKQVIRERENMHILPAGSELADVELSIAKSETHFNHLKDLLAGLFDYDFIIIDCAPSLSLLTLNALNASEYIIIPMQMDVLALRGFDSILGTIAKVRDFNTNLEILGVLPVMVDTRKNIHWEILNHIKSNYPVRVFERGIRASVKAAEAPSFGQSVIKYAPDSTTSKDFKELAGEVFGILKIINE